MSMLKSHSLTFTLSHSHTLALSHSHTLTLSHSQTLTLSHYYTLTILHSYTITISQSYTLTLLISQNGYTFSNLTTYLLTNNVDTRDPIGSKKLIANTINNLLISPKKLRTLPFQRQ